MELKIVISSYNSLEWLPETLNSVDCQTYTNYEVCVVDDGSDGPEQAEFIEEYCSNRENWNFIIHDENMGALYSQVEAINSMNPNDEDIIIWVDGDDRLADENVFQIVVDTYLATNCLMTYGSYRSEPYSSTCSLPRRYPKQVERKNSYRAHAYVEGLLFNHLRTVKYVLFKHLNYSDFTWPNGQWFRCCGDTAVMIPCLEMAGRRYEFINRELYVYNSENPVSDWRRWSEEIDRTHAYILKRLRPKNPL